MSALFVNCWVSVLPLRWRGFSYPHRRLGIGNSARRLFGREAILGGDQIITTISFIGLGMPGFLWHYFLTYTITVLDIEATGLFSQEYLDAPWSVGRVINIA